VAEKPKRIRVYILEDVGEDGAVNQMYVRQPSQKNDQGYWAGLAYISGRETTVGSQAQHTVLYDVPMDDHVPVSNSDDCVLAVLGADNEEVQFLKVLSVGLLPATREKIARTMDVSDENWADRLTV
jgi:hypothetical protein